MPKVKPLTRAEREARALEAELQRVSREFLILAGERRGRDDINRCEMAELIGVSRSTFYRWRRDGMANAPFGQVVSASRKLGYRVEFVPVDARKGAL